MPKEGYEIVISCTDHKKQEVENWRKPTLSEELFKKFRKWLAGKREIIKF